MKNRMLAIASLALMVTPVMAQDTAATAADGVFRSGVAYCNQASKLSRADTAAAGRQSVPTRYPDGCYDRIRKPSIVNWRTPQGPNGKPC